jgi:hypothetical protein
MRQVSASPRLTPKAAVSATTNIPMSNSVAQQRKRLSASFMQPKPPTWKHPGTAPGRLDDRLYGVSVYRESAHSSVPQRISEGTQGQNVEPKDSASCPSDAKRMPSRSQQQRNLTSHLTAVAALVNSESKLRQTRSARSSHMQQYLRSPSCVSTSKACVSHGTPHRPSDKSAAIAEAQKAPLAVSAFWDTRSSGAGAPIFESHGEMGLDLLTYMKNAPYAATTPHTRECRDSCRPSTVPNMCSRARQQSGQGGGEARPSTSIAAQHPRADALFGPWEAPTGEPHCNCSMKHHTQLLIY